jgi:integrative and conjugative element protein (TIGR02256 family)
MFNGVKEQLWKACKKFKPKETGGVLIGVCNYKTKSIHVYDFIGAPKDSQRTSTSFIRGVSGLSDEINEIKFRTGDMIGYVGEWHTHPMQLETLSIRDKQTIDELLPKNRMIPIPTLSLIVTNSSIHPYIYL